MSSNIIGRSPKKSDAPSEKVEKLSGDLDDIENPLVTTIDIVDKKVKSKLNVVEGANTSPIPSKKKIDTVKKQRNHKHPKNSSYLQKNKPDTLNSIGQSRSTKRTNLSNKITTIKTPTEADIVKDNKDFSDFSRQGDDLVDITSDNLRIPHKN